MQGTKWSTNSRGIIQVLREFTSCILTCMMKDLTEGNSIRRAKKTQEMFIKPYDTSNKSSDSTNTGAAWRRGKQYKDALNMIVERVEEDNMVWGRGGGKMMPGRQQSALKTNMEPNVCRRREC